MERTTQEWIDSYISGHLTPDETSTFEEMLEKDDAVREQLVLTQHIANAFQRKAEQEAMTELQEMTSDEELRAWITATEQQITATERQAAASRRHPGRRILLAVVAAAAMVGLLLYIGSRPQYTSEELFDEYINIANYEPEPIRSQTLPTAEQAVALNQAIRLYQQQDYPNALQAFEQATTDMPTEQIPEEVSFYTALCYIETDSPAKAIELLQEVVSREGIFGEDAEWNLALAYLGNHQEKEARTILEQIIKENGTHAAEADELINKLQLRRWF